MVLTHYREAQAHRSSTQLRDALFTRALQPLV